MLKISAYGMLLVKAYERGVTPPVQRVAHLIRAKVFPARGLALGAPGVKQCHKGKLQEPRVAHPVSARATVWQTPPVIGSGSSGRYLPNVRSIAMDTQ
jgi:hypothetical protein